MVAIGIDPSPDTTPDQQAVPVMAGAAVPQLWLELLREGLSFDLCGLMPGPGCPLPAVRHRFDLGDLPSAEGFDALAIVPGPHLAGGARSQPVLRGMLALARDLTQHFTDLAAIVWAPSHSAIGRRFFESVVTAWLDGGAFPALGLTAFEQQPDGALQSVGLDCWIGQEVRIEPPLSTDKVAATRLGIRLVNQLVITGGLKQSERITAPDGTRLVMHPSRDSTIVRVWRE
ncbi:MAG: hypothetical protein NWS68_04570 [Erythrobacter sp.]|nr:hypothetical protein [Erythrobacter sp.]